MKMEHGTLGEYSRVNMKIGIGLVALIALALLGSFTGVAYAATITGSAYLNMTVPVIEEEYYAIDPFNNISASTYKSMQNCSAYLYNGTILGVNGTFINLEETVTGTAGPNTTWRNNTYISFPKSNGDAKYAFAIRCMNGSETVWSNNSYSAGLNYFRINEWASNSVTFTDNAFTNGTVYSSIPAINITISDTATSCSAYIYNATESANTWLSEVTLANASGVKTVWANSSALSLVTSANSSAGAMHAIIYKCVDVYGNTSWSNTTAFMNNGTQMYFDIDFTDPSFYYNYFSVGNSTTGGNYINLTMNITDDNLASCGAYGVFEDTTNISVAGTISGTICTTYINPDDLIKEGNVTIYGYAVDDAGNNANSTDRNSYIVYNIRKATWTPIVIFSNSTFAEISAWTDTISYVSIFNNPIGYKNFTTHTTGSSTNSHIRLNDTINVTWLYTNEDTILVRQYNKSSAWTQNETSVIYKNNETGWNMIGFTIGRKTVNTSASVFRSYGLDSLRNATVQNVTHYGIVNRTTGYVCAGYFNRLSYSCFGALNTSVVYIPTGYPMWIQTNINTTLDIGSRP